MSNVSIERDDPTSRKTFTMPVGAGLAPPANSAPQEDNAFVGRDDPGAPQTVSPKGDLLSQCGESKQSRTKGLRPFGNPRGFQVSLRSVSAASSAEGSAAYSVTPPAAEMDLGFTAGCESSHPVGRDAHIPLPYFHSTQTMPVGATFGRPPIPQSCFA